MPYVSQYGDTNSHIYYVNGEDDDDLPNPIGYLLFQYNVNPLLGLYFAGIMALNA